MDLTSSKIRGISRTVFYIYIPSNKLRVPDDNKHFNQW